MKIKSGILCLIAIVFASCTKKDNSNVPPLQADNYSNAASGSSWSYHLIDSAISTPVSSDYTITSTSGDSSINGKMYHVFNNSAGRNQYLYLSGHDYYEFDSLPTGLNSVAIERLYLKDDAAAGISWSQNLNVDVPGSPIPIPFTVSNTIAEKGITRTVNGTNYTDVIHVSTAITSSLIPSASLVTSINSYYAPKVGLIENSNFIHLDFVGNTADVKTTTKLVSATLK